jgi:hypothetical protein
MIFGDSIALSSFSAIKKTGVAALVPVFLLFSFINLISLLFFLFVFLLLLSKTMGAQMSRRKKISSSKKTSSKTLDLTQSNSSFASKSKGTELFGRLYHDVESSVCKLLCTVTLLRLSRISRLSLLDLYPMDEVEQDRLHGVK